jgi:hypothetical protein
MGSVWTLVAAFSILLVAAFLDTRLMVLAATLAIPLFVGWLVLRNRSRKRGIEVSSPWSNIPVVPADVLTVGSGGLDHSSSHSSPVDGGASADGGGTTGHE